MIRSRLLNAGIGLLGLLFLAAGVTYLTEDISWAGWKGLFNPHALLLGVMNLCLGAWCAFGSYRNFRDIHTSPRRPLSPAERAARIDAFVIAVSIVILATSLWQTEGPNGSRSAFYRYLGVSSSALFILSVIAVPFIAAWASRRKAP